MNTKSYIQNLFYTFLTKNDVLNEKIMFVRHYNSLILDEQHILKDLGEEYREGLVYKNLTPNDIPNPYDPFLSGIKFLYQKFYSDEMSVSEFLFNCDVYSLHREIFESYIENGYASRYEALIVSEIDFEMKKMFASIFNCYKYIGQKHDVFVVINNFQYSEISTIELIKQMISSVSECNFKILMIYNEGYNPISYVTEAMNLLVADADEHNMLYEWEEEETDNFKIKNVIMDVDLTDCIRKINNLFHLLAIKDASYYIDYIHNKIVEEKFYMNPDDQFDLYYFGSLVYTYNKEISSALIMSERLLNLYDRKEDLIHEYGYNYVCGQIQMSREQSELTISLAKKCIEIAHKLNDDEMLFQAEAMYQSAQFGGWRDVFVIDFDTLDVRPDIIEKLRQRGHYNTLAYCLIFGYDNDKQSMKNMAEGKISKTYVEGISLGKQIGNTCFLLSAYTKYIIVFTENGFHKYVEDFYTKKLEILSKEHNERRKAHLLMGMGYNNIIGEEYSKANIDFCDALEILYKQRNAEEIAETLYNMVENCICVDDYTTAYKYMNVIFKILDNLDIETIQICNTSKLYGLMAFIYYKLGNNYRCFKEVGNCELIVNQFLMDTNKESTDFNRWNEDIFLYYFILALLDKENKNVQEATNNFKMAKQYFEACSGVIFYIITPFISEYYDFLISIDEKEQAFEIMNFGINYCKENGYTNKAKKLLLHSEGSNRKSNFTYPEFAGVNTEDIIELSYNVGKENQLEESKKSIRFLSTWQEKINKDNASYAEITKDCFLTLEKNFNLDEILFVETDEIEKKVIFNDIEQECVDYDSIISFFKSVKKEFIVNRNNKSFLEYGELTKNFKDNRIVALVGIPIIESDEIVAIFIGIINKHRNFRYTRKVVNEENILIMKTAIIQLRNAIERIVNKQNIIMMNEKLNMLAVTDTLTGLYNRQGLSKMLEQNEMSNDSVAILYADLDNFKYYNDTFGHDVGDIVLKAFADIFRRMTRGTGYAVRYGGDEFLMILNNQSKEQTVVVANRIYKEIEDGFIDVVSRYLRHDIEIPADKRVSCSIGISFSRDGNADNISKAMKEADSALYYMKRNSKGHFILWEEIHEEV